VLTERGRALLNSDGNFRYRREVVRITKKSQRAEAMAAASADPVTEALLTRLKDLRRKLAAARGVPAYVVFSDRSLIDMAKRVPLTRHDFSEVHGVGEAKLKEFGDLFLNEIAESFASTASP
jgi:ATP-dependent DNA helicase RecQ